MQTLGKSATTTLQGYTGKENVSSEMELDADEVHEEMKRCKPAMAGYSFRCSAHSVIIVWISMFLNHLFRHCSECHAWRLGIIWCCARCTRELCSSMNSPEGEPSVPVGKLSLLWKLVIGGIKRSGEDTNEAIQRISEVANG